MAKTTRLISAACISLPFLFTHATFAQTAAETPNVLLIIADDMGVDASACYNLGDTQALMPNLEQLCSNGMVFDNAYSAPVCSPTRATIMTGKYGFRTGVGAAISPSDSSGLSVDEVSIFDVLNDSGYTSNIIGKWHLGGADDSFSQPSELGVSDYYGVFKGALRDYSNWTAISNGEEVKVTTYSTTDFTNKAVEWIGKQDTPWFLWLAYNAPHTPFHLPPKDLHSADDLPDDDQSVEDNPLPYYNAMLEALDTEIGRLLSSMPDGVRENTVVIFIGDNGTPGKTGKTVYGDNGMKGTFYEGGVHVPFIAHGPGVSTGRSAALINTTDLYATISGLAGVEGAAQDSISFVDALGGGMSKRTHVYVEHFSDTEQKQGNTLGWAIRDAQYKFVSIDGRDNQLFDLTADPLETNNLMIEGASAEVEAKAAELQKAQEALK